MMFYDEKKLKEAVLVDALLDELAYHDSANQELRTDNDKLLALVADLQDVIAHQATQLLECRAVMVSLDHPVYQAVEVGTFIPQDLD